MNIITRGESVTDLTTAIVQQAIYDWRYLCRGREPTKRCNFKELEEFFRHDCEGYIDIDVAQRIYRQLKRERRESEARNAL